MTWYTARFRYLPKRIRIYFDYFCAYCSYRTGQLLLYYRAGTVRSCVCVYNIVTTIPDSRGELCGCEHHVTMVLPPVRCQDSTAAHTQNYHYIDREDNRGIKGVSEWVVDISRCCAARGSGSTAFCRRIHADAKLSFAKWPSSQTRCLYETHLEEQWFIPGDCINGPGTYWYPPVESKRRRSIYRLLWRILIVEGRGGFHPYPLRYRLYRNRRWLSGSLPF